MTEYRRSITDDSLFEGRLRCRQFKDGYRFSIDAVLLAHFCRPGPEDMILDLCSGTGIISLILAYRYPHIRIHALDIQEDLVLLAEENTALNGYENRILAVRADLREIHSLIEPESCDLVICNPPFFSVGKGRTSLKKQQALARHDLEANVADVCRATSFAVRNRGRAVFIFPASRLTTLLSSLRENRLEPKRLKPVYSFTDDAYARLVLVEVIKNGGEEMIFEKPLYLRDRSNGDYSIEVKSMYEG